MCLPIVHAYSSVESSAAKYHFPVFVQCMLMARSAYPSFTALVMTHMAMSQHLSAGAPYTR